MRPRVVARHVRGNVWSAWIDCAGHLEALDAVIQCELLAPGFVPNRYELTRENGRKRMRMRVWAETTWAALTEGELERRLAPAAEAGAGCRARSDPPPAQPTDRP